MKVTGTWHGEYTYGAVYEGSAGKSVPFVLSLTDSWVRGILGYVRDDETRGGMPGRGRIVGSRRGAAIRFVKTMPRNHVFDENGQSVDHREWLRSQGIEVRHELPPHEIHYSGELSADGTTAAGRWIIHPEELETNQGTFETGGGEGTWTARRVSDLPTEV